jgi:hypothetical protein
MTDQSETALEGTTTETPSDLTTRQDDAKFNKRTEYKSNIVSSVHKNDQELIAHLLLDAVRLETRIDALHERLAQVFFAQREIATGIPLEWAYVRCEDRVYLVVPDANTGQLVTKLTRSVSS